MGKLRKIARRSFLIGSAAIAGGVAFGTWRYLTPYPNPVAGKGAALTPYVVVDGSGITIITPRAEMGQGIHSTLAALVAEEMDLSWDQIRTHHGPPSKAYFNGAMLEEAVPFAPTDEGWLATTARHATQIPAKFLAIQLTCGSTSIPDAYDKMRAAGATARAALVQAASLRLGLPAENLTTASGAVVTPDGQRIPYTDLAEAAAQVDLPRTPPLKPRSEWKLLGQSLPRTDMVGKCTGTATFSGDIRLPGMKFATIRMNPNLGAPMTGFDATAAEALPGVERVIPLPGGVAVVAQTTWHAMQGAEALKIDWAPAPYPGDSTEMRAGVMEALASDTPDSTPRDDGQISDVTEFNLESDYHFPHLAHAAMEPMQATALFADGRLTLWTGTQAPGMARDAAARAIGIEAEAVTLHTQDMGGAFGRRAEVDCATQAALIAQAMEGTPILLTWSREEDMTHDMFRPMAAARIRATLREGKVAALDYKVAAPSIMQSFAERAGFPAGGPDSTITQGAWEQPYDIPHFRVQGYRAPKTVPVGFWRSVGASINGFALDSAMDELAHLASRDPLEFRLSHMTHAPSRLVLETVAKMSNWGSPRPGRALGVAFCLSFGVPTAEVIEVAQTPEGIRLTGAWAAVDVGVALDPRNIEAQVAGGMVYGLSAAMTGEITFAQGQVQQRNFPDYDGLRIGQCPDIQVLVLQVGGRIRGIGEPGTPPAAPALANALFALTGTRARDLPLSRQFRFA